MHARSLLTFATVFFAASLTGQVVPRRATIQRPADDGRGRCTAVVVVDGAAEIEIRGDSAFLRDLSGAPAQWRRFDCTGPVPDRPVNFRFNGVDGRGRQTLTRDPRDGRGIEVRIEDPQGGAGEYKFDIAWDARPGDFRSGDGFERRDGDRDRGFGRRFSSDEAIGACQGTITQLVLDRYRARNPVFRDVGLDRDRPDTITGTLEVRRDDRDARFRFRCSVDFDQRRIRDTQIDPMDRDRDRDRR